MLRGNLASEGDGKEIGSKYKTLEKVTRVTGYGIVSEFRTKLSSRQGNKSVASTYRNLLPFYDFKFYDFKFYAKILLG